MQSTIARVDLPSPLRELYDCREIEAVTIGSSVFGSLIQLMVNHPLYQGARFASVANQPVVYGVTRMASLLAEGMRAPFVGRAFREMGEAEAWLVSDEE